MKRTRRSNLDPLTAFQVADFVEKKISGSTGRGRRRPAKRKNSAAELAAAGQLAESWSGRAPHQVTEIQETLRARNDFADLGGLEELVVERNGYAYTLRFGNDVRVAAAVEPGADVTRQIYFVGGDQELDLDALDIESAAFRDKVDVGRVRTIVYVARKDHLEGTLGPYEHRFGEEGGSEPLLVYDCLNQRLELVGGTYEIRLKDYDGRHSAGIRD